MNWHRPGYADRCGASTLALCLVGSWPRPWPVQVGHLVDRGQGLLSLRAEAAALQSRALRVIGLAAAGPLVGDGMRLVAPARSVPARTLAMWLLGDFGGSHWAEPGKVVSGLSCGYRIPPERGGNAIGVVKMAPREMAFVGRR